MSIMEEVDKHLNAAEKRVVDLIARLENITSLEEGLADAERDLRGASKQVVDLAERTASTTQSLQSAIESFQGAVEILKRSDPAQAMRAISQLESKIEEMEKDAQENFRNLSTQISEFAEKAAETEAHRDATYLEQAKNLKTIKIVSFLILATTAAIALATFLNA